MARTTVTFSHETVGNLSIMETGLDDIAWSYNLNTANFPTYGGEVVQILSVYIDDLAITGTVGTYQQMEAIYRYFARYMIHASQGVDGKGEYNQKFMTMHYIPRNWTFKIQPLSVPGFVYATDTVAPEWRMAAHVVDDNSENYATLKEMAELDYIGNEDFARLKGIVSPASADPTKNPFAAPVGKEHANGKEIEEETGKQLHELGVYYNNILESYITGDYSTIQANIGAKPAFGKRQNASLGGAEVAERLPDQEFTIGAGEFNVKK